MAVNKKKSDIDKLFVVDRLKVLLERCMEKDEGDLKSAVKILELLLKELGIPNNNDNNQNAKIELVIIDDYGNQTQLNNKRKDEV